MRRTTGLVTLLVGVALVVVGVSLADDADGGAAGVPVVEVVDDPAGGGTSLPELAGSAPAPLGPDAAPEPARSRPSDALLAATLGPTRRVSGRMRRLADDSPLAGVRISSLAEEVFTDVDGRFAIATLVDERELLVTGTVVDAEVRLPPDGLDHDDLDLVVDSGWVVEGVVREPEGAPVAGAVVTTLAGRTVCDEAGVFRIVDVAPASTPVRHFGAARAGRRRGGSIALRVTAGDHAAAEERVALRSDERTAPPVEIVLPRGSVVEGRVSAPSGVTVEGLAVELSLRVASGGELVRPDPGTVTDTSVGPGGSYRFDGVPPGTWVLGVGMPPSVARMQDAAAGHGGREPSRDLHGAPWTWVPDVEVVVGTATRRDIALPAGGVVVGTARDAHGDPIEGVRMSAWLEAAWPVAGRSGSSAAVTDGWARVEGDGDLVVRTHAPSTFTDDEGRYVLGPLAPGPWEVVASSSRHWGVPDLSEQVFVDEGATATWDPVFAARHLVRVEVVDHAGRPLGDAVAELVRPEELDGTDREFDTIEAAALKLELTAGETGDDTDGYGHVTFTDVEDREWVLGVGAPRHRARLLRVRPSPVPVRVVLDPAQVLAFRLLDARTGRPVPARVGIGLIGSFELHDRRNDRDGLFVLDDLPDERFTVTFDVPGYREVRLDGLRPHPADDVPRDVFLEPEVP